MSYVYTLNVIMEMNFTGCTKKPPGKEFCKRADEVWYWDSIQKDCFQLPVHCYNYDSKDNAFPTKHKCIKKCFYD